MVRLEVPFCNLCEQHADEELVVRTTRSYEINSPDGQVNVDLCDEHSSAPLNVVIASALDASRPKRTSERASGGRRRGGTRVMTLAQIEQEKKEKAAAQK